jgi:hypothetical protein
VRAGDEVVMQFPELVANVQADCTRSDGFF